MSLLLCGKILTVGRNDVLTNTEIPPEAFWAFPRFGRRKCMPGAKPGMPISPMLSLSR